MLSIKVRILQHHIYVTELLEGGIFMQQWNLHFPHTCSCFCSQLMIWFGGIRWVSGEWHPSGVHPGRKWGCHLTGARSVHWPLMWQERYCAMCWVHLRGSGHFLVRGEGQFLGLPTILRHLLMGVSWNHLLFCTKFHNFSPYFPKHFRRTPDPLYSILQILSNKLLLTSAKFTYHKLFPYVCYAV